MLPATTLSAGSSTAVWPTEVTAAAVKQQMPAGSMAREDNAVWVHRTPRVSDARTVLELSAQQQ